MPERYSSLSILLVEDNALNQELALLLLEELGYQADVAADGLEALNMLQNHSYHIVLMDVEMPKLNGMETTRRIRQSRPGRFDPYIVAMTANTEREGRKACLESGMNDYVAKPLDIGHLQAALDRYRNARNGINTPGDDTISAAGSANKTVSADNVLDRQALDRLRSLAGSEAVFREQFIATFLRDAPAMLIQIRQSIAAQDANALRRIAHTLKSNSASFGATRLSQLCRELEQNGKTATLTDAAGKLDQLEREYNALSTALKTLPKVRAS